MPSPGTPPSGIRTLAERAYPGLKPSGFCSRIHHGPGDDHYDCTICFPDVWALIDEHRRVADQARAERDQLRLVLERIAARRPATDDAPAAFYRSRRDAKESLR